MKLPKGLHSAAKVRMDYNENHDEKGRFSVSSGSGASYKTETMPFGDKGAAKAYAKRASNADKNKTFDVRGHLSTGSSKVHHSYYQGKEIMAGAKGNPGVSGQPAGPAKPVYSVHAPASQSAIMTFKGEHNTEAAAHAEAKKVSVQYKTPAVVMHNQTNLATYRNGEKVERKVGSLSDIGRKGDKPATREGAAERGRAAGPGVAMRAEAGDKDAQAAMKEYHVKGAADNKAVAAASKAYVERTKAYHTKEAAYHRDMAKTAADPRAHLETAKMHDAALKTYK